MHHVMEEGGRRSLIGGSYVLQSEWHDSVAISTPLDNERRFFHVLWSHQDLTVPEKSIHKGQHRMTYRAVN